MGANTLADVGERHQDVPSESSRPIGLSWIEHYRSYMRPTSAPTFGMSRRSRKDDRPFVPEAEVGARTIDVRI